MTEMTRVDLPPPGFPMVLIVITDNIAETGGGKSTIHWMVSKPHPFVPNMLVARMFADSTGVEIYSSPSDGKGSCMRDVIQMSRVRLVQEVMPPDVFIEEIADAESEDDEEPAGDDGPEIELNESETGASAANPNGQSATS